MQVWDAALERYCHLNFDTSSALDLTCIQMGNDWVLEAIRCRSGQQRIGMMIHLLTIPSASMVAWSRGQIHCIWKPRTITVLGGRTRILGWCEAFSKIRQWHGQPDTRLGLSTSIRQRGRNCGLGAGGWGARVGRSHSSKSWRRCPIHPLSATLLLASAAEDGRVFIALLSL